MSLAETKTPFFIDPDLMEQVIINLLKNAKEAVNQNNGAVSLVLKSIAGTDQTEIVISDNGKGISDAITEKVFVPFYTTKSDGSGIGLSLARQIVQLHKGELSFQTSDTGTSFFIKL